MPTKTKKTKKAPKSTMRLIIPLPLGWRLYIPASYLILPSAIVFALLAIYLLRGPINKQVARPRVAHRQVAQPHNIPAPVPAMTTAAALPDAKDFEGVSKMTESSVMEGYTTIRGKVYRLPLTTESYVVEVRHVVGTKRAEDI
ncbi:MAG: hypothetical protein L6R38_006410 [Xanthoria sp. 2 TBL-2021]|nr:MAG: hypothetical protein L6R38_006410 [Xanthoria sp. 2 TBL-2021]